MNQHLGLDEKVTESWVSYTAMQALKKKAENIRKTLGMRQAAGFLRNLGLPFEVAHEIILGYAPRCTALPAFPR